MMKAQCEGFWNTPTLWEGNRFDIKQFEFPDLDLESIKPQALPQNIRLGHQVEYIFKQLLDHSESYDLILHNLQVRNEARTLGEIDFIVKDIVKNKLVHIELTYKFYIIDTNYVEPAKQLIGPNRRDTFLLKKEKIKKVQFPLLHSAEGVRALHDNDINHNELEHQCCFKVQLYRPYHNENLNLGFLNQSCIVGYWVRLEDLEDSEFLNAQFYMPSKSEWIIKPHVHVSWQSPIEIRNTIKERLANEYAPMIWMKKSQTKLEKFFVVWW